MWWLWVMYTLQGKASDNVDCVDGQLVILILHSSCVWCAVAEDDDDVIMSDWLVMVQMKNELVREESDLIYRLLCVSWVLLSVFCLSSAIYNQLLASHLYKFCTYQEAENCQILTARIFYTDNSVNHNYRMLVVNFSFKFFTLNLLTKFNEAIPSWSTKYTWVTRISSFKPMTCYVSNRHNIGT